MKLRSSKAACYVGAAIIFFAVPVLPAVATTYEKPQNTDTGIKVASYSANTEEVLVTGYEQTGTYKNKAVAFMDPYLDVFDSSVCNFKYSPIKFRTLICRRIISADKCIAFVQLYLSTGS